MSDKVKSFPMTDHPSPKEPVRRPMPANPKQ